MNSLNPEPLTNALIIQGIFMFIAAIAIVFITVREIIKPLKQDEQEFDSNVFENNKNRV